MKARLRGCETLHSPQVVPACRGQRAVGGGLSKLEVVQIGSLPGRAVPLTMIDTSLSLARFQCQILHLKQSESHTTSTRSVGWVSFLGGGYLWDLLWQFIMIETILHLMFLIFKFWTCFVQEYSFWFAFLHSKPLPYTNWTSLTFYQRGRIGGWGGVGILNMPCW